MSKLAKKPEKKGKVPRFRTVNEEKKSTIFQGRKAPNTNKATKLWLSCFTDYLDEKNLPGIDDIETEQLPTILEQFYTEVRKKEKKDYEPSLRKMKMMMKDATKTQPSK